METEKIGNLGFELVRIEVDTNHSYWGPRFPTISSEEVENLCLAVGQMVVAYMPPDVEDEWMGKVGHDWTLPEKWQWWIELNPEGE